VDIQRIRSSYFIVVKAIRRPTVDGLGTLSMFVLADSLASENQCTSKLQIAKIDKCSVSTRVWSKFVTEIALADVYQ
jgi:hypothetical protein